MMNDDFNQLVGEYGEDTDKKSTPVPNDEHSPRDHIIQKMADREEQYTKLTENFVTISYKRYKHKEVHKWIFFWVMIIILLFVTTMLGTVAIKLLLEEPNQLINHIPSLLGAFASFISTVIAIPILIGKYLFNKNEESDLGKIVENMQKYDRQGQELFKGAFDSDKRNH
ncbi:MAG: hypothetical protein KH231_06290 [Dialister sp.]|uniref:hypothetical protein n=1 Tax=Dialister sp. TaxID=1955814 RepID=UPI001DCBCB0B|nr:hypothetical protein [Dialister sp.]MBS6715066.1 hypothetical protein [Dialister sp.]